PFVTPALPAPGPILTPARRDYNCERNRAAAGATRREVPLAHQLPTPRAASSHGMTATPTAYVAASAVVALVLATARRKRKSGERWDVTGAAYGAAPEGRRARLCPELRRPSPGATLGQMQPTDGSCVPLYSRMRRARSDAWRSGVQSPRTVR